MEAFDVKNYRKINVKFIPPTNYSGSRIKIFETKRYDKQKTKSKTFAYSYEIGNIEQQAYTILINNGWQIVARCQEYGSYSFLCDGWANDNVYKEVNNLK
tara:strand:+ start:530 stop:829 length:300 start_codon:yes stop_codon:yes gene_type:complete